MSSPGSARLEKNCRLECAMAAIVARLVGRLCGSFSMRPASATRYWANERYDPVVRGSIFDPRDSAARLLQRDMHINGVTPVGLIERLQYDVADGETERGRISGDRLADIARIERDLAPVGPRA